MNQTAPVTDLALARQARAERAEAVVRPDPDEYAQARCALPACGKPLYIERTESSAVYLSDTVEDLAEPGGATSWQVACEDGHVVLLPTDGGTDSRPFGECWCGGDTDYLATCGHNDMARLRRVVA